MDSPSPIKLNIYGNIVSLSGCFESVIIRQISPKFVSFGESLGKVADGHSRPATLKVAI